MRVTTVLGRIAGGHEPRTGCEAHQSDIARNVGKQGELSQVASQVRPNGRRLTQVVSDSARGRQLWAVRNCQGKGSLRRGQ